MPKLSLLYGPAHPDKSHTLFRACLERIHQRREDSFFYLVPSRRQASHLRQKLLEESGSDQLLSPKILALEDFVQHLYRLCPDRRTLLSTAGQRLLLDDILRHQARSLTYFRPAQGELFSGLSLALVRFIQELRAADISPELLDARRHELAGLAGKRGAELLRIYRAVIEGMAPHYIDYSGTVQAISTILDAQRFAAHLPRIDLLLVSGFAAFEPPLKGLLERLFTLVAETQIAIDFVPERPQLFGSLEPAFEWLKAHATQTIEFPLPSAHTPLARLEDHLFSAPSPAQEARIQIHACSDRPEEVRKIARHLRCMGTVGAVETAKIRVLCPNPDLYAPLFQEIFPRYGLQLHLSRGFPLSRSPVVVAILAILDTVLDRYARTTLLRLLKLPYFRFHFKAAGEKRYLEPSDIDSLTRTLPSASGGTQWLKVIDSRCEQLESELAGMRRGDLFADELEDPDRWLQQRGEERDRLLLLRQGMEALFDTLSPLEKSLDLPAFCHHLRHILERLGLFTVLLPSEPINGDPAQITRDLNAYERFFEVLDELASLTPLLKRRRFTLDHLAASLKTAIAQTYYQPARNENQGILIAPLEECRWLSCDELFVCGLVEGDFPRPAGADIFLDDRDRRALGLPPAEAWLGADRLLFYQVLSQARREIHLLFPQDRNTDSAPSPFINEVQSRIKPWEKAEMTTELLTRADLHAFLGKALCQPPTDPMADDAAKLARHCRELPAFAPALERLLKGLAITDQRTRLQPPGSSEGHLDHPEALDLLNRRFGIAHAFSITQLESYARCPFLFFAEKVLGILPLTDPAEDNYALDRGNLIHRILYSFYSERRRNGRVERIRLDNLPPALERLHHIARREAQNLGLRGFFWEMELERMMGTKTGAEGMGLFPRFLELEARELETTTPSHFELSFGAYPGMGPRDPLSTQQPLKIEDPDSGTQVRILGKIDRIDRTPEGKFVVLDYKTGRTSGSLSAIREGLSLQLPIYLLAIENLLGTAGLDEGVAGAYYELRDHEHCGKTGLFANKSHKDQVYRTQSQVVEHEAFRTALEQTRSFVLAYVRNIQQGRFHVTPHPPDKTCSHCLYKQSCRLDARRMQLLKRQGKLT